MPAAPAPSTAALGAAVADRRRELHLKQEELAAACGVHRAYLAGIEQGRRNPTWRVLGRIADGLGLQLSELAARAEAIARDRP